MLLQPAANVSVQVARLKRALGACLTFFGLHRRWLAATTIISCATTALSFAAGCTSIRVATGQRIRLTETQIYPPLTAGLGQNCVMICPGGHAYLLATLKGPNGETLVTEGEGRGKILWNDLHVACSVVSYNGSGGLFLPADPRFSDGQTPHVVVSVPNHPELRAEFDVPISYNAGFTANFSGQPGFSGRDGNNGTDGTNGQAGSTDPQNPSPGGNGANGTNGTDGENGQPGGDAHAVFVRATLKSGGYPLLQIYVSGGGTEQYFMVDPNGGYLTVYADAGFGGAGGRGGRGGTGGVGGAGRPNGRNGANGANGRDGFAAPAGNGGAITVIYDPSVQPYLSAIRLSSRNGPAPVFQQEPVTPLW